MKCHENEPCKGTYTMKRCTDREKHNIKTYFRYPGAFAAANEVLRGVTVYNVLFAVLRLASPALIVVSKSARIASVRHVSKKGLMKLTTETVDSNFSPTAEENTSVKKVSKAGHEESMIEHMHWDRTEPFGDAR